jgi:hypothetical protein
MKDTDGVIGSASPVTHPALIPSNSIVQWLARRGVLKNQQSLLNIIKLRPRCDDTYTAAAQQQPKQGVLVNLALPNARHYTATAILLFKGNYYPFSCGQERTFVIKYTAKL